MGESMDGRERGRAASETPGRSATSEAARRGAPELEPGADRLPGRPDGVVFDCDGLLVDTEPCWERAERRMFARRGLPMTPAQRASFIGKSGWEVSAMMAPLFGEDGRTDELADEMMASVLELIRAEATVMPGARDVVALVATAGIPIIVASNSPRDIVDAALVAGGLDDLIDEIVAIEEVARPKPAPDVYLEACRRLDADPARCVAFEDSGPGLASAAAAGLFVVAVPSPGVDASGSGLVATTLDDPALRAWIGSWASA